MSSGNDCPGPSRRSFISRGAGLAAGAGLVGTAALGACASRTQELELEARLDEQLATLVDRSGDVPPIAESERAARRARLGRLLAAADLDAMLIEPGATLEYLAGTTWGRSERLFGLVVLADGSHFWICPAFEAEKARLKTQGEARPGGDVVTWDEHEYAFAPLAAELERRRAPRLCVEPSIRYVFVDGLATVTGRGPAPAARALLTELRGRKDEHELALLRRANELTQEAIVAAGEWFRPGMTGRDIGRLVKRAHERLGLTGHWDLSLIGPAAAYPHGEARDIELARGDVILIDTGGDYHGYQSDNTRSWVFDAPPSEHQARIWHAVHDAQRAAFDAILPGVRAGDVDLAARRYLEGLGLTEGYSTFSHRLGHGIGMEGHEDPYFDSGSEVRLAPGMTLSDEPGIYLYGEFGVRIEDIVAVTAQGAEHFGSWQRGPGAPI
jgi:Xaa-Pro dipeptidase